MRRSYLLRQGVPGAVLAACLMCAVSCAGKIIYEGGIDPAAHPHLKNARVFIDPGHGGMGDKDAFRTGPGGVREEVVNLRVSLILADMLARAGASVKLSRDRDEDVPLAERAAMAREFNPQLLVSIHHNGSYRRRDEVNYPSVLIWGSRDVNPQGYDFATLLLEEFHRTMDARGTVLSDFSVYPETGTLILRETRNLCAGVIGEGGFFSDPTFALHLNDIHHNMREAEAYFEAISRFFKRGIPSAEILVSAPAEKNEFASGFITDRKPVITLRLDGGTAGEDAVRSLYVTLDGLSVSAKKNADGFFVVDYGRELYPGIHLLRFSFENARGQHSMVYCAEIAVEALAGDYARCVSGGRDLARKRSTLRRGLQMLLSAYSIAKTQPDADALVYDIARAFNALGDRENSDYYYARLYHFYPGSTLRNRVPVRERAYRFPADHLGKKLAIIHEPPLKEPKGR